MRKLVGLLVAGLLVLGFAGSANAAALNWHGTIQLDLGAIQTRGITGTGTATVNNSSGGTHLNTIRLNGGITDSAAGSVTDPDTSGTIPTIFVAGTLGSGTFTGISGGPPGGGVLPLPGLARVCIQTTGCAGLFIPLALTTNNGATGVGVGGLLTALGVGGIRFSVQALPWTIGSASGINQTSNGAFVTLTRTGFVHGPASNNTTTLKNSGVIQLISPANVAVLGVPANATQLSLFSTLTLHFVPEPGLLLLIGSGVVGLGLLGRKRLRK